MTGYIVAREDDFDFRSAEYTALYDRSNATPFQHPIWLSNLYEVLAPRRKAQKQVVTVRGEDGRIVLVLPFVRRRLGPLRLIEYADLGVNDYAAPVLDCDEVASLAADRQVSKKIRRMLGRFDLLRIDRVADSPDLIVSLIAGATAKRHAYDTHLVNLPETAEAWRAQLDPKFLRHLERKYKRLRPKGERRLRIIDDVAEVEGFMERMQNFRAARFAEHAGTDLVQDPDCFSFYSAVARASVENGPGSLAVLEVAAEPAAVALNLIDRDRDIYVLVGYDVERLRNYSLGLLIVDELVQNAIGRQQAYFDLTVGDEPYNADFGAHPRPVFEIRVQRTLRGRILVISRTIYLQARRLAKQIVIARKASGSSEAASSEPAITTSGHRGDDPPQTPSFAGTSARGQVTEHGQGS
jgi:CelD/BcsL family acetyltransferase involved in cellulose biosynthesis